MKICILSTSEKNGGAAIACNRLMKALRASGIEVKMLVRDKQTDDKDVVSVNISWLTRKMNEFRFLWERLTIWRTNCFSKENLFAVSVANTGMDITRLPEIINADIIHIHWVNHGFLALSDIAKLIQTGKPVVWTMHDMWPATGICHHARECDHYQQECGSCFFLKKPLAHDLSYRIFKKKQRADFDRITYVACSEWLRDRVKSGTLLKGVRLLSIPNSLDTVRFASRDRMEIRKKYFWEPDKYYLLFGAANISDPRKGYDYYFQALELLIQRHPELNAKIELVFMGSSTLKLPSSIPYGVHFTGYLSGEDKIIDLYSAVDVFVMPSLEENLPNSIMESMSCGTPVVGFNVGGIPEMIDHLRNGYVAEYKDCEDLMEGIYWVLVNSGKRDLGKNAREKVVMSYAEGLVADRYIELYQDLLKNKNIVNE